MCVMKTLSALFRLIKLKMLSFIRSASYKGYCLLWLFWQGFVSMCFRGFRFFRLGLNGKNDGKALEEGDGKQKRGLPRDVEGSPDKRPVGCGSEQVSVVEEEEEEEEDLVDLTGDELYCGYDSTWESEPVRETKPGRNTRTSRKSSTLPGNISSKFSRFERAAKDMWNYRHDYPNLNRDHHIRGPGPKPNLDFYLGKAHCLPDRLFIHDIHKNWYKNYNTLEYVHTYIQWLFPLQEPGMNSQASTLTKQEIEDFCHNDLARQNLLTSYKLMLDFYGIELINEQTGDVTRAENWMERFNNLNSHTHNSLRITRILKCLGTLGYRHYQAPLVHFFLNETLANRELPNVKESVLSYFLFAVLDKRERKNLLKFAYSHYRPREEFVWCPKKIQMSWN